MESREFIDLDLGRYLIILKRRWLAITSIFVSTVALSFFATTLIKPSYEAEGKILFRMPTFKVVGNDLLPNNNDGIEAAYLKSLVSNQNPISTQMEVIYSPALLQETINKLELKNSQGELLRFDAIQSGLKLKIIGGTDVLRVTYTSSNPEKAAAIVNTIMSVYLENEVLTSRTEAEIIREFMSRQLPYTQATMRRAEVALRMFKQKNNIADLGAETRLGVEIIGSLEKEMNAIQAQLADINAQSNELLQKLELNPQEAIAVSTLSQSRAIQGILVQLQEVDIQLANQSSRFLDNNPVIISLEARKANLSTLLQQQIDQTLGKQTQIPQRLLQMGELRQNLIDIFVQLEVQRFGLEQKLTSLNNSRSAYEERMKIIPQLEQAQRELERKIDVSQSTYQNLLTKVQELQLVENVTTPNARIIAHSLVPEKPDSRKKLIVVVLGVMFGGFLATASVLLFEMIDKSLKTLQEVTEVLGYTLLGVIPLSKQKILPRLNEIELNPWEVAVRDQPNSVTSEIYRMIQANLKFLSSDTVLRTIVVSSAVPQEGKSTVSANLAAAIAQLGRKVLLIDAHMRVPTQHHLWKLTNRVGLSEVLVGENQFETAVNQVMDHLDVLTAGVRPPNPLALLDSKRMASLIKDFSSQYDFVIIDAPPLLLGADAVSLSQMSDGILLVARPGIIDYGSAGAIQELLQKTSPNILGLVVNGVTELNKSTSYLYHAAKYSPTEHLTLGN
ncbi:polysaccharide biosynthesis tyrosine autokinase [Nodularia harveyana UHCC-0300]|uniref:non-specific protein-tyrosine kinase n=1 Tax=Nodularia harveyana UHCC-0300 TaxID=2974287 RepID=A0ABU5U9R5_9CYAN|nr:polysaccharide biosynthesis tyrosine autokinase [Nodularia harveyana]MEA5580252.1 polysaccharide biosynthesis tyrosine autokinase [Nodularia harveyana UHCC-0300]